MVTACSYNDEPIKESDGKFQKKLEQLINECSMENESDTPDFILAEYLKSCLEVFNKAMKERTKWYSGEHE